MEAHTKALMVRSANCQHGAAHGGSFVLKVRGLDQGMTRGLYNKVQRLRQQPGNKVSLRCVIYALKGAPASTRHAAFVKLQPKLGPKMPSCTTAEHSALLSAMAELPAVYASSQGVQSLYLSCLQAMAGKAQQASAEELAVAVLSVSQAAGVLKMQGWPVVSARLLPTFLDDVEQADAQAIASVVGAVAVSAGDARDKQSSLELLLHRLLSQLAAASADNLVTSLQAVAILSLQLELSEKIVRLFQQMLAGLAAKLEDATGRHISMAIVAAGSLKPSPLLPALLLTDAAVQCILRDLHKLSFRELADIAVALGRLGWRADALLQPLYQQAAYLCIAPCSLHIFSDLCWAAAVLDAKYLAGTVQLLAWHCSSRWGEILEPGWECLKCKLYQTHVWLQDCWPSGPGLFGWLADWQLLECRNLWVGQVCQAAQVSRRQHEVLSAAQQLGPEWRVQHEALTEDCLHQIDVLAEHRHCFPAVRVAIEVDGHPSHFRCLEDAPTGKTLYRNRALVARKYTLVVVPYWEWDGLQGNPQRQVQYLQEKVREVMPAHGHMHLPWVC